LRRWEDAVEQQIREATERGDFDNLRGVGKRLNLEQNVFAGDKALAYSLLKNNNLAPPEIERGREIDADLTRADALLTTLRRRRDAMRAKHGRLYASDRRAYNVTRDNTEARYETALRAVNSKILSLNITAPPIMHRRTLDIEARLRDFRDEFPHLPE
jgi:DnaJ family protein C protein 28